MEDITLLSAAFVLVAATTLPRRIRDLRLARRGPRPASLSPVLARSLGGGMALFVTVLGLAQRPDLGLLLVPLGLIAVVAVVLAAGLWNRDLARRAHDSWSTVRLTRSGIGAVACYALAVGVLLPMLVLARYGFTGFSVLVMLVVLGLQRLVAEVWVRLRRTAPTTGT